MTLIDYFNAFQVRSQEVSLSANARSLYFAILGEFNKLQYPAHLKLQNTYLQHLSGINSTCSFDSARNALINSNCIFHKKQLYSLTDTRNTSETLPKDFRKVSERVQKDFSDTTFLEVYPEEKEKEKKIKKEEVTTTTATARARENGWNSVEVQEMWFKYEGEQIPPKMTYGLYELEKNYGTEAVCKAIAEASPNNKENRLTLNFVKAVLERQQKGVIQNGRNARNSGVIDNSQYAGDDYC